MKTALSFGGLDPSGGAGILRDVSIFRKFGITGMAIPTALTIQNEKEFKGYTPVNPEYIKEAFFTIIKNSHIDGIKTGMLTNEEIVNTIAEIIQNISPSILVVDPVLSSSTEKELLTEKGMYTLRKKIVPLATVITPNYTESLILTGKKNEYDAAKKLREMGVKFVIIKGGHREKPYDLLFDGKKFTEIRGKRFNKTLHGSGCIYSSTLLSELILGRSIITAMKSTKKQIESILLRQSN